jgi:hypothetical protein
VSSAIERPVFFENQILGAVDLTATVDLARGQQARHNRYLHLWGIAYGLELEKQTDKDKGDPFIKITLKAGLAIDGTGREIIVPEAIGLSESTFSQLQITPGANLKEDWFPVFLVGRDQKTKQPPLNTGACNGSSPTRVLEGYEITFGRPGEARKLDEQNPGTVSDGSGNGGWKILLGFVQWDGNQNAFNGLKPEVDSVGRRYAGVQADEIAARGGSLQLRTQTKAQDKKPALVLDETEDGQLRFGTLDAAGALQAVFTVTAKGDVKAEGKIVGALAKGITQVESGIATDGMILPLPTGVTQKQVDDGDAIIQTQISLRLTGRTTPPGITNPAEQWTASPLETWVDSDRRVHCRVRWQRIIAGVAPVLRVEDHAAACNYLVLASLKEKAA